MENKIGKAINTLIEGILTGQSKGAYSLEQSSELLIAIKLISTPPVEEKATEDEEAK